jgi:pilus assembly protein CpaB
MPDEDYELTARPRLGRRTGGARRRGSSNPRQRQGLLLLLLALVGLAVVFALIVSYVNSVSKQVGDKIEVLTLSEPLTPYEPVTSAMVSETLVPAKWAPRGVMTNVSQALGLITQVKLPAGTELQQGMLSSLPTLTPGMREIAILVDAETGVAGQIEPGDRADIVATFSGGGTNGHSRASAQVVVADARVLEIGQLNDSSSGQVPVTFALTPKQVLAVSYAESFSNNVRLSLVAPGGTSRAATPPVYSP